MKNKVLLNIENYNLIQKNDIVIVGVSGGHDSVSLLHILHSLSTYLSIELIAVHINHKLRGIESEEDQKYVEQISKELGIKFYKEKFDVLEISKKRKVSIEVAARDLRYAFFEQVLLKEKASKIAVAHNKNDQAETVFMNMIRGSGLDGLMGMEFKRNHIIRPILNIERKEIEKYCDENNIHPRVDKTNLENIYTRNKVRLDLIPMIEEVFSSNITNSLCRMSKLIKDDNEFIREIVKNEYQICRIDGSKDEVILKMDKFNELHIAIKKRVFRAEVQSLTSNLTNIQSIHVDKVIELAQNGTVGKVLQLPRGIRVIKDYKTIRITLKSEKLSPVKFKVHIKVPGKTMIENVGVIETYLEKKIKNLEQSNKVMYNSLVQFFDYDKIGESIVLRNRLEGDFFKPLQSKVTKKLKKYFIDQKVPKDERDKIPLLACNSEILWIIGTGVHDNVKVDDFTENILKVKFNPICEND